MGSDNLFNIDVFLISVSKLGLTEIINSPLASTSKKYLRSELRSITLLTRTGKKLCVFHGQDQLAIDIQNSVDTGGPGRAELRGIQ